MSIPKTKTNLQKLSEFKDWMQDGFKKKCIEEYGRDTYNNYIHMYVDDMLENVEFHLEDLAEQVLSEEEMLMYDFDEE